MEDAAHQLKLFPQLGGVGQVAVVGQSHGALHVTDHKRLGVGPHGRARGGIPAVADAHVAPGHGVEHVLGEHLVHQAQIPAFIEHAVVVHGHAAALLAAVLQCVQRVVGGGYHVQLVAFAVHAEHAALLVNLIVPNLFHGRPLNPADGP